MNSNEKVKFLLNWNRFSEHLSSCMTKLMTDVSYSDIIIATSDKHMIYAHRFVLANSSKYFQRLLKQMNRQKNIQLVVALPEIKYEIFKILMNYMYKGETQVPHELLPSVIKAGQILEINGLIDLTEGDNNNSTEASLVKYNSEGHTRSSIIHSPKGASHDGKIKEHMVNDKIRARKNSVNFTSRQPVQPKKRPCHTVDIDIDSTSENLVIDENRRKKQNVIGKPVEKKDISLPIKRRPVAREIDKEKEKPSSSTENSPAKKPLKKSFPQHDVPQLAIKTEKDENWENESQQVHEVEEEITIKTEAPDDVEEVSYNELQCDYCQQGYSNPSDWVRHMTEFHSDRGYQTYKEFEKDVNADAVYTCVICSSVLFSAADWARHLRIWHTEKELAAANLAASKKGEEDGNVRMNKSGIEREKVEKNISKVPDKGNASSRKKS